MTQLLILILCLLIFLFARKFKGQFNPIQIFAYIWAAQMPLAMLFSNVLRFKYTGLMYIELAVLVYCLGGAAATSVNLGKIRPYSLSKDKFKPSYVAIFLALFICLAFVNPIITIHNNGFSLTALISFNTLLEANNAISIDRYTGGNEKNTIFSQLFLVFTYTAPLWGGFAYHLVTKKLKWLSIASIVPGLFIALTQGVKMCFITSIVLWIAGFFVCILVCRISFKIKKSLLLKSALGFVLFLGVLFLSMMFRIGKFDAETAEVVSEKFSVYAVGHLPAFDLWFSSNYKPSYTFGLKTFYGISNFLGIEKRVQGIFSNVTVISNTGELTNIYTVFRLLIDDFGALGCLIYLFINAYVSMIIYRLVRIGVRPIINSVLLMAIYFHIFWSFVTNIFAYTSYIVMFVLIYFIMIISYKKGIQR